MADAITTKNPVSTTKFIVNKYEIIEGNRANQETPRGRLCFRDTNGRMTLPRTVAEADLAFLPIDWAKPLNPPPYFEGVGLNGMPVYPFSDGSLDAQENAYAMDPDVAYQAPGIVAFKQYDIPPYFYDLPVVSGNKCLVYEEGYFTYGSGNYVAPLNSYALGAYVYAAYTAGDEGKPTYASSGITNPVGRVFSKEVFGSETLTVKLFGEK